MVGRGVSLLLLLPSVSAIQCLSRESPTHIITPPTNLSGDCCSVSMEAKDNKVYFEYSYLTPNVCQMRREKLLSQTLIKDKRCYVETRTGQILCTCFQDGCNLRQLVYDFALRQGERQSATYFTYSAAPTLLPPTALLLFLYFL